MENWTKKDNVYTKGLIKIVYDGSIAKCYLGDIELCNIYIKYEYEEKFINILKNSINDEIDSLKL